MRDNQIPFFNGMAQRFTQRKRAGAVRNLLLSVGIPMLVVPLTLMSTIKASRAIDLTFNFGDGITPGVKRLFGETETFWESKILGYQSGISLTEINIDVSAEFIDNTNGILAEAGPTTLVTGGFNPRNRSPYFLADTGSVLLDSADLNDSNLSDTITHEVAHVLGFGTVWDLNDVYQNGTGRYTGIHGLTAYQKEFDPNAAFVPVDIDDAHWDPFIDVQDPQGRPLSNELLNPFVIPEEVSFVSKTTIQSFRDIGYVTVPEPSTTLGSGLTLLIGSLFMFLTRSYHTKKA